MHPSSFYTLFGIATIVQSHMELSYPAAFRSRYNPHAVAVDYSMTSPLKSDGSDFPCKGYHKDMQDAGGAGAPVATWNAGSEYNFTVVGGATHNGGSCQAALSYDNGASFKVIHSYIGECPIMTTGNFKLSVPSDAKPGNAIFAWSWVNQVGNREYYMNCASIKIESSSGNGSPKVPFSARPNLFKANLNNGCTTVEGKDAIYPDPGPDVTKKSSGSDSSGTISGNCGGEHSSESEVDSDLLSRSNHIYNTTYVGPSIASASNTRSAVTTASNSESTASVASDLSTPFSILRVSSNGECSGSQTCSGSIYGGCCSKHGYCGHTASHCGDGCMGAFGVCGMNGTAINFRIRRPYFGYT